MKRLTAILLSLVMALGVTACGSSDSSDSSAKDVLVIENNIVVDCDENAEGKIVVPDSVTSIGKSAFYDCNNISVTYKGKTYTKDNVEEIYTPENR